MIVSLDDYITDSKYFKWKEALYLKSLGVYHSPSQTEVDNIKTTCLKLDKFRKLINKPFSIHCWIRPTSVNDESGVHSGVNYNALPNIKGATNSSHIPGLAVDFHVEGMDIDTLMNLIKPKLSVFKMAAENNNSKNGRTWCHLQNRILSDNTWRIYDIS